MDSLALVNRIHQYLVIQWILPCSTTTHLFTWFESHYWIVSKTLGSSVASFHHAIIPGCNGDSQLLFDVLHIDPHLYVYVVIFLTWRRSTMYFWWLQSLLVMESWIHNVSPSGHDLKHCLMHGFTMYPRRLCLHTEHRYACLRDIHVRRFAHCCLLIS